MLPKRKLIRLDSAPMRSFREFLVALLVVERVPPRVTATGSVPISGAELHLCEIQKARQTTPIRRVSIIDDKKEHHKGVSSVRNTETFSAELNFSPEPFRFVNLEIESAKLF